MKILVIGDVFGKPGRQIIKNYLDRLKQKYQIDLTIANVENSTHGKGISWQHYQELKQYGIDVMTSGNHIFDCEETQKFIQKVDDLLRPANSNPYHPGKGSILLEIKKKKVRITNLLGTVFMPSTGAANPYYVLEKIEAYKDYHIHLVDFHAQATAEKIALAIFFDGRINALWGTHTHVQTADERIMPKGTAFITDVGMTGPSQGVIGAEPNCIIQRSREGLPVKIIPDNSSGQLNGIVITIDDNTNKTTHIERIMLKE